MDAVAGLTVAVLSAMLLFAGVSKLRDPTGVAGFLAALGLGGAALASVAYAAGAIEVVLAVGLLFPPTARIGASTTAGLMVVYAAVMAGLLVRGARPDCRCFGQSEAVPIGWRSVVRNLAIAALVLAAVDYRAASAATIDHEALQLTYAPAVILLVGLLALAGFHYQLLRQHGRIITRLSALESRFPSDDQLPADDLEIGAEAPWFPAHDQDGRERDLEAILDGASRTLLLFSDRGCPVCGIVIEHVKTWIERQSDIRLVVLNSKGSPAADGRIAFLQTDERVYQSYHIRGVPTAVVLDRHGRVEHRPAIGPDAIQRLCAVLEQTPDPEVAVSLAS